LGGLHAIATAETTEPKAMTRNAQTQAVGSSRPPAKSIANPTARGPKNSKVNPIKPNSAKAAARVPQLDVDVTNLEELIFATLTRADPATSIDMIQGAKGAISDPRLAPWDRASKNFKNRRMIIDACRPFHWRDEFPEINQPSADSAKRTHEKFGYLLE